MYHELTYKRIAERRRSAVLIAILLVLLVAVIVYATLFWQNAAREQATSSVRTDVLEAAVQCCAIEGSYPSSLSHLEEEYGLVINHNDFVVNYEWIGGNIAPSVTVKVR